MDANQPIVYEGKAMDDDDSDGSEESDADIEKGNKSSAKLI